MLQAAISCAFRHLATLYDAFLTTPGLPRTALRRIRRFAFVVAAHG
jgi:hypothetical protein